jgi:dihydroneopterin aldolase
MDKIQLSQIRAYGYTGVLPEEQALGQWFEIDLVLWLDLAAAGASDRLDDTLDYRDVIALVQKLVKTSRFALLERLASAIATDILDLTAQAPTPVKQVQIRLTKLAAPIPDFNGKITIELIRSRL